MLSLLTAPDPNQAILSVALIEIGNKEWPGSASNPRIDEYLSTVGMSGDETPWCAAFINWVLKQCDIPGTGAANARSFLDWGMHVDLADAKPGDICVFKSGKQAWQGHVAILVERRTTPNGSKLVCVGGNQSNMVCKQEFAASELLGIRRYKRARDSKTIIATTAAGVVTVAKATVDAVDMASSAVDTAQGTIKKVQGMRDVARDELGPFTTTIEREPTSQLVAAPAPGPSTLSIVMLVIICGLLAFIVSERLGHLRKGR